MEGRPKRNYKYCLVPTCSSTTISNPAKRFLSVPVREPKRSAWLTAIRHFGNISSKTHHHVCEDHFNLEEDIENYTKLTFFPESRVILKAHVVPHIFDCQRSKSEEELLQEQPTTHSKAQRSLHKNPFYSLTKKTKSKIRSAHSRSRRRKKPLTLVKVEDSNSDFSDQTSHETVLPCKVSKTSGFTDNESDSNTSSKTEVPPLNIVIPSQHPTPESQLNLLDSPKYSKMSRRRKLRLEKTKTAVFEKETQTDFKKSSIGVMARPLIRSESVQCDLGCRRTSINIGTSP